MPNKPKEHAITGQPPNKNGGWSQFIAWTGAKWAWNLVAPVLANKGTQ